MMSQNKDARKMASVNLKLKKLVDWKIFELQSILVSDDVDEEAVNESLQWFQPRHFSEVVEERINDGRCGYPLCLNPLDDHTNAAYRINYAEKKIYSIELSARYCCVACIEKAQLLEKKFDDSVPYSRSVIKTLDLTASVDTNIDEVLNLLTPHPAHSKSSRSNSNAHEADLPLPPVYTSSVLSDTGSLTVAFVDGLPVPPTPAEQAIAPKVPRDPLQSAARGNEDNSDHGMDVAPDQVEEPSLAGVASSALHREVYHSRENAVKEVSVSPTEWSGPTAGPINSAGTSAPLKNASLGASSKADVSMAEMFATMNALRVKHNLTNPSTAPTSPAAPTATRFTNGSLLEKPAARVKKDLVNATASGSTVRSGTMGRRPGPRNVRWGANSSTSIDNTASVESMSAGVSVRVRVEDGVGAATEELPVSGPSSPTAPIANSPAAPAVPAAAVPPPIIMKSVQAVVKETAPISGSKRTTMQLSGQVMERVNPRPMSAAAMMRKREDVNVAGDGKMARKMLGSASSGAILSSPPATTSTSAIAAVSAASAEGGQGLGRYDRDEVDRGDDEGEQWVDVDPAELLALGFDHSGPGAGHSADADNAMSIEGYIANVKRSIRVSPATTIKNLSHSPYTYRDINHLVNAAHTDYTEGEPMDEEEEDDGNGGDETQSVDGEDEDEVATHNTDEGDGAWETEDEGEGMESGGGALEPAPTQSMFLTVWATMDELFGASLDSVFQQPDGNMPTPVSTATQLAEHPAGPQLLDCLRQEYSEPMAEASRPPIALEQQNAQHAFVKLLQRGIQSAEAQLSLTSMVLTLHEERSAYAVIKHKLLNTANNTLQKRNNFSSALGTSNAGTGLHSAGWTLIGLLVIDAVVTKRQIGPLRRKQKTALSGSQPAAGTLAHRDVSAEAWNAMIERAAADVLSSAATRKNSNVGKLREGDLQILRSYFDYI